MDNWRAIAAKAMAGDPPAAIEPPPKKTQAGRLSDLVEQMARQPKPRRISDFDAWTIVVRDAVRLVREGWCDKALALGWSEHDLFGVGARDSWEFSGLAVWLEGRPILAIASDHAVVRTARGEAYFNRKGWGHGRDSDAYPILLWEFGR